MMEAVSMTEKGYERTLPYGKNEIEVKIRRKDDRGAKEMANTGTISYVLGSRLR